MLEGGLEAFLTSPYGESIRQWGHATRDLTTALLSNLFQAEVSIENPELRATTPEELEAALPMPALMAQVDLLLASGDLATGLLLVGADDASLISELAPGLAGGELAEQSPEDRLANVLNDLVDTLNRANPGEGSFAIAGVSTVESPEAIAETVQGLGDELAELSYALTLTNIIEGRVVHVLPLDFLIKLAGLFGDEEMATAPPPERTARPSAEPRPARPTGDGRGPRDQARVALGHTPSGLGGVSGAADLGALGAGLGAAEPTVRAAQFAPLPGETHGEQALSNIDLLLDVSLNVTVELGRALMTIKEILALGPGSIVELDKLAGEPVDILVNERPIAKGEVVIVDENFGVRVTDITTPAKRVASLR